MSIDAGVLLAVGLLAVPVAVGWLLAQAHMWLVGRSMRPACIACGRPVGYGDVAVTLFTDGNTYHAACHR